MSSKNERVAPLEATPKNNQHNTNYHNSLCQSRGKLKEKLAEQVVGLWVYLQCPFLCQTEYRQSLRLFESTLRKYLAVKSLEVLV